MKTMQVLEPEKDAAQNPCQLKKRFGSGKISCSAFCAITFSCPIMNIDSHEQPVIRKVSAQDLEPIEG